jgi:hypothetical protein
LTGLRITVDGDGTVLPLDAMQLFVAENDAYVNVELKNPQATFSQNGYAISSAIDGNAVKSTENGWAIAPQTGQNQSTLFELSAPLERAKSRMVEITIHQNFQDGQHSLGRFRLSVTDAAPKLAFGLPPEITAVLAKPSSERSDAERTTLLAHVRKNDSRYQELRSKLTSEEQPLPPDPRLKELQGNLDNARQPLTVDSKLAQLRRAVALSEGQLKQKRLTVAQDIVWALINTPSFLYNH